MPLPEQHTLAQILLEWGEATREWKRWLIELATVKGKRDNRIVALKTKLKHEDPKIAESWAKTLAEADEQVQAWALEELIAEANVEALRKRLAWHEMRAKGAQSEVATAREEARVWASAPVNGHAPGVGGVGR